MRKIKFRAWDKKRKIILDVGTIGWTKRLSIDDVWCAGDMGTLLREDVELMQYTGLKDKNGKEIWEGDICRVTEEYHKDKPWVAEVAYVQSGFCFVNRKCCSHCAKLDACICTLDELIADVEIIGNIYENKELI
jgi:uncharacterized phage protein (TIGR01671 family)